MRHVKYAVILLAAAATAVLAIHFPLERARAQATDPIQILRTLEQFYGQPDQHIQGASANVANASAVATLAATAGKTTYISKFRCSGGGATAAAIATITVAGLATSEIYQMGFVAGVGAINLPVDMVYNPPQPASAVNTAITVTMAAGGAGNTNASCVAQGFQQ